MAREAKPDGTERLKAGRIVVKVSNHPAFGTGWIKRSHLVYYENTGHKVPAGFILHHRDKNKTNDQFLNLELKTQSDHVREHNNSDGHPMKGRKHSAETKEKMGIARLGNKNRLGKPVRHSEETKAKIGTAHLGMKRSEETREKIRAAAQGRKHSEETRAKMRETHLKRNLKIRSESHGA